MFFKRDFIKVQLIEIADVEEELSDTVQNQPEMMH